MGYSAGLCEQYCRAARDLASASGCVAEHQAIYACIATEGLGGSSCDEENTAHYNCVDLDRPNDCTRRCYDCTRHLACQYVCPLFEASAAVSGCGEEWRRLEACSALEIPDTCPTGLCGEGELDAWNACIETFCSAYPEDCAS